jgi:deoxycytidylate deaminase/dephospho-CoA kinase
LNQLFWRRSQFVVIALTGRTGSGCSSAAEILSRGFSSLPLDAVASPLVSPDDRKYRIVYEYGRNNWEPFIPVSVTLAILSFVLESDHVALEQALKSGVKERELNALMAEIARVSSEWASLRHVVEPGNKKVATEADAFLKFWKTDLGNLLLVLRKSLGTNYSSVFQMFGDNLRSSGSALGSKVDPKKFFALPTRVAEIVVALRELQVSKDLPARIVIDALRNPFEIEYFRQRFASFFLVAITTPDAHRKSRLAQKGNMSPADIKKLDAKEYPAENKPLAGSSQFVSQNIQACLERADIFVENPGLAVDGAIADVKKLGQQLLSFVVLMQHPGLVTPTRVERCMQIAYSARANSGCISRQVGAAIADAHFSIKAVGWNDVPAGQVPCLLRRMGDLVESRDREAFSDYELHDERFQKHMQGRYKRFDAASANGRSCAFCFKSEYNVLESAKMRGNQVHTRSLHAEENAFLQISKYGGAGIEGGILFTTASPCELCSKKAFQLGIKHIYYIDPYPGISTTHILGSGLEAARPKVELFSGAVGQAFHRLYDPVLPFKDEIEVFMNAAGD